MRFGFGLALGLLSSTGLVAAQTYTDCNPMEKSCPADPAFGKSDHTFDFTKGGSTDFKATGNIDYDDNNGAAFTIAKQGDGPLIQSGWYIMFGKVEFTIKAAPGKGIVSSAVLQSDTLDEIDWEWLGGNNAQVQSNYFGKGDTSSYSRGAYHDDTGNHDDFHTYSIDWTSTQLVWSINGKTVRVLTPETADANKYPQTPMMIKVGSWAGGDPNNAQGTIDWAGGEVDYSQGPFTMYLKSMTVTDYSTGSSYSYGDKSGSWESIKAKDGKINGNSAAEPKSTESAPTVTETADSMPMPWSGTHKETSSWVTPNVWPWVPTGSPTATSMDWESSSHRIQPPSGGSMSEPTPTSFCSTPLASIAKTGISSQSSSRSTSARSASSSAVFSRSGIESPWRNTTRLTTSTTSEATQATADLAGTFTMEASSTSSTARVAPSAASGGSINELSFVGAFWALLCSVFALL
ncbi:hypothetical protein NUU61_002695 [Penicillium alfredii]|uniref:Crh-like protein n=1 Tax=Penicillium alfredii TaxID=1506179 RepID=A0A9W9FS71_9EURO|nr:uncharacterized protein NUU61_002695 [Penicillium alfredii]KAJ5105348.1 hypothetical protein NUU61_002695 [Penicillium alfredii]